MPRNNGGRDYKTGRSVNWARLGSRAGWSASRDLMALLHPAAMRAGRPDTSQSAAYNIPGDKSLVIELKF